MQKPEDYMKIALKAAEEAFQRDEVPIGAVMVDSLTGSIIAHNGNRTIEFKDPTAHAEILVVREACHKTQTQRLPDYDLYVTLEPCPMCAAALSYARIRKIYFGATDSKSGGLTCGPKLYEHSQLHHKPEIIGGILGGECTTILKKFFAAKR